MENESQFQKGCRQPFFDTEYQLQKKGKRGGNRFVGVFRVWAQAEGELVS